LPQKNFKKRVNSSRLARTSSPRRVVQSSQPPLRWHAMSSLAEYFDGNVKSLANKRLGRKFSVGIISPGEYYFGTDCAERMHVTCGELRVKVDGKEDAFVVYAAGTCFEVAAKSGFAVRAEHPTAYHCEYL